MRNVHRHIYDVAKAKGQLLGAPKKVPLNIIERILVNCGFHKSQSGSVLNVSHIASLSQSGRKHT